MKQRAVTLIEVLIVVAIIAIIAALLFPVLSRSKEASKVTVSISRLKQLHLMTKLYQADYDGDGRYGLPQDMGLPLRGPEPGTAVMSSFKAYGFITELILSPCGCHPHNMCGEEQHMRLVWSETWWVEESQTYREMIPLYSDFNCNSWDIHLSNDLISKRGITVLLSGTARTRQSIGNPFKPEFFVRRDEISN